MTNRITNEVHTLCLVKGFEKYIWIYSEDLKAETLRSIGRFAAYPQLSLTWYDAAKLSQEMRESKK